MESLNLTPFKKYVVSKKKFNFKYESHTMNENSKYYKIINGYWIVLFSIRLQGENNETRSRLDVRLASSEDVSSGLSSTSGPSRFRTSQGPGDQDHFVKKFCLIMKGLAHRKGKSWYFCFLFLTMPPLLFDWLWLERRYIKPLLNFQSSNTVLTNVLGYLRLRIWN